MSEHDPILQAQIERARSELLRCYRASLRSASPAAAPAPVQAEAAEEPTPAAPCEAQAEAIQPEAEPVQAEAAEEAMPAAPCEAPAEAAEEPTPAAPCEAPAEAAEEPTPAAPCEAAQKARRCAGARKKGLRLARSAEASGEAEGTEMNRPAAGIDSETALVAALLYLLTQQGADPELLLALAYILV